MPHVEPVDAGPVLSDDLLGLRTEHLPADLSSAGRARRVVREALLAADRSQWLEACELATSEIVTNAVLHAHTDSTLTVARARRISDGMLQAAADAVAGMVDVSEPGASLLPAVSDLRPVSATVAVAVVRAALDEGLAQAEITDPLAQVSAAMWEPVYPVVEAV